jgi:hypothetical protein
MTTMPPSHSDAIAEARRLLEEAQEHSHYVDDDRTQKYALMAAGHVLLAIGTEVSEARAELDQLAGIRREVAGLSAAVRELTTTLAKAADPVAEAARALPDIANAISDLPDRGEGLADVATAVESLAANMERPRPSWVRRFVRRREAPASEVAEALQTWGDQS